MELGCFFSVNAAMFRDADLIASLPLERVLTETDHPFGDRASRAARRPGEVEPVERALGRVYELEPQQIRARMWRNLARLVSATGSGSHFPRDVRTALAATP